MIQYTAMQPLVTDGGAHLHKFSIASKDSSVSWFLNSSVQKKNVILFLSQCLAKQFVSSRQFMGATSFDTLYKVVRQRT